MMSRFLDRIKFVKFSDVLATFPMLVGALSAPFYRLFHPKLWLVCERKDEARDNGYWFFKYVVEKHPEQEVIYAINRNSKDYGKIATLGRSVQFGSIAHWMLYFAAEKNISSQKSGKPNAALCYILEVYLKIRKNRIYLRHGIVKDDQKWIYYEVSKIQLFCCTAKREHDYILENFGYDPKSVKLLGLCRYDNLLSEHETYRRILVMPTSRSWLDRISSDTTKYESSRNFLNSEYFTTWNNLLCSEQLKTVIDENDYEVVFFIHSNLQRYIHCFDSAQNKRIIIANPEKYDVQELLMSSAMLITDYSSVFFDFGYMNKPLIYYHFDYEKYREGHYKTGYFSYEKDGFGPIVKEQAYLLKMIEAALKKKCKNDEIYSDRSRNFFYYRDDKNCERTYNAIKSNDYM